MHVYIKHMKYDNMFSLCILADGTSQQTILSTNYPNYASCSFSKLEFGDEGKRGEETTKSMKK